MRTKIQEVVINKKKNYKQFRTSLPIALIEALRGKGGDQLEWTVENGKLVGEVIRK